MKRSSHFRFSKSQRSGIFFLGICVVVVQVLIWQGFFDRAEQEAHADASYMERLNVYLDSLDREARVVYKQRPFNPNYMSDQKGYGFGMTTEAIDRLFAFREKGGFVNTAKQFQEVTGIHDTLLAKMAPYFQFPRFAGSSKKRIVATPGVDINAASASDLEKVYGIGPVLAGRIVAYRERLGGFAVKGQLEEVYGLPQEVLPELWQKFHLDLPVSYEKLDINTADLKALSAIPYVSQSLASKILAYRSMHKRIDSLGELTKFHNLSEKDLGRIGLYLVVE
ncbi:helix-hairpin-helix domain-containing protein [Robertkochia sediminum]|uniref:helix-hairpin-helix domain-containing protein n=1 Tax=Robertkochia sediminum TaxID=2785326 RepID=UPI0019322328|nr:helix-hairpin-helix domain-containing protein [Robertkochia sediminum]MBL7471605.1 helix-hairpin-helix domain-containing protein [Robertkochia sediminum]